MHASWGGDSLYEDAEGLALALALGFFSFGPVAFLIVGVSLTPSIIRRWIAYPGICLIPAIFLILAYIYARAFTGDYGTLCFLASMSWYLEIIFGFILLTIIPLAIFGWAQASLIRKAV
jgi:hypothetical protein